MRRTLLALLFLSILAGCGENAGGNRPGAITINASHNTIINIGAGRVSMTSGEIKAIVETAAHNTKELDRNATKLFELVEDE